MDTGPRPPCYALGRTGVPRGWHLNPVSKLQARLMPTWAPAQRPTDNGIAARIACATLPRPLPGELRDSYDHVLMNPAPFSTAPGAPDRARRIRGHRLWWDTPLAMDLMPVATRRLGFPPQGRGYLRIHADRSGVSCLRTAAPPRSTQGLAAFAGDSGARAPGGGRASAGPDPVSGIKGCPGALSFWPRRLIKVLSMTPELMARIPRIHRSNTFPRSNVSLRLSGR